MRIELHVSCRKVICFLGFFFSFLLLSIFCNGQDLPKVVPPSPEASSLFRFQDYPMDYSTGLPSVSIPLYEVKSGSLNVPITLGYHASGRRVSDQDGPVALGWSLDAGGIVSRTVYASPDFGSSSTSTDAFPFPFRTNGLANNVDYQYFEKIMHYINPDASLYPYLDAEYDVFSYNFGGNGGKFIFKDSNAIKTPVLLPYKPYIVTPFYNTTGLTEIDITDDKGIFYKFSQPETGGPGTNYVTSLSITQMISADKVDTINFIYTPFTQWSSGFNQVRTYVDKTDYNGNSNGPHTQGETNTSENASNGSYQVKRLIEIDFKLGKVLFNLVTGTDKIDNIQVKDLNNQVIKTIQLNRSLLDHLNQGGSSSNPNMTQVNNKLDALMFTDNTGNTVEKYGFEYYPTKYAGSQTGIDQHYIDWWGFYNASGYYNMIPHYDLPNSTGQGTDQVGGYDFNKEPDLEALKSGVLKKISFPTGGTITYTYENNRYGDAPGSPGKNGPGLRVAQTSASDNNGGNILKTYKYGVNEIGYGSLDLTPDISTMGSHVNYYLFGVGSYGQYTLNSTFNSELSALGGRPIIYNQVSEYLGTPDNNQGKTVYEYDNYVWAPAQMQGFGPQPVIKKHISNWNYWNTPSLVTKTDYRNTAASPATPAYALRKSTTNAYTINNIGDVPGLHVQRLQVWPDQGLYGTPGAYIEKWFATGTGTLIGFYPEGRNIYSATEYHIPVGIKTLASTQEKLYSDDGTYISNITTFNYNSKFYLSGKTQTNSDGSSAIQNTTYPFDYSTVPVLTQMSSAPLNMLNFPIEQLELKNAIPVKSVRTNYYNFGTVNPMMRPQTIEIKNGGNNYETRIRYFSYDSDGNPSSFAKENDAVNSFIWDYKHSYPVAEVKNAALSDIAYTSFEADGKGNWNFGGAPVIDLTAITGTQVYDPVNGAITKSVNAGNYTVSYWSKNGGKIINGSGGIAGRTIRGWTYYENKIGLGTSGTITINASGPIDELRLFPSSSQMTSFTYAPLIGQTAISDLNGEISYYEYDSYNRLKNIKDYQGNIIKNFQYNYLNSCGPNCVVLPMQTFNGSNTISYPVGVFNVNGQLLGKANNPAQFIGLWNANGANQARGVLSGNSAPMSFNFSPAVNQTAPTAITGLRYYQFDLAYNQYDGVVWDNCDYVDFGDGTGMRMGATGYDQSVVMAPNTYKAYFPNITVAPSPTSGYYLVHSYSDNTTKTLTMYHSDDSKRFGLGNGLTPATSMTKVSNLRGNIPQYTISFGGSSLQSTTYWSVANIINWNSINSIQQFGFNKGDGVTVCTNVNYAQDFMANNKSLKQIKFSDGGPYASHLRDLSFKISKLKSDWNTYFTNLEYISLSEDHWNHEDLSALTKLNAFGVMATNQNHSNDPTNNPAIPLSSSEIDNIIIQIAAGAGQSVTNGVIYLWTAGSARTAASTTAFNLLKSKGWAIIFDGVNQ